MLTGAMVAIAPGSPLQLLIAMFVCLAYLLLVVHAAPFKGRLEDHLAFVVSLCLTVSLALGFALITDDPARPVFDTVTVGILLIAINVTPFAYGLFAVGQVLRFGPNQSILAQGAATATGRGNNGREAAEPANDTPHSRRRRGDPLRRRHSLTSAHVKQAVVQEKVSILEKTSVEHREAHVAKIKDREARADARVRQRLAERRAKRERTDRRGKVSVVPVDSVGSSKGGSSKQDDHEAGGRTTVASPAAAVGGSVGAANTVGAVDAEARTVAVPEGVAADVSPATQTAETTGRKHSKEKKKKTTKKNEKKRAGGGNKARSAKAKSSATAAAAAAAAAAEMVRKRVRAKIDTPKKLAAVFGKLDVNHNGMLSKAEFGRLVGAVLKPERPSQEVLSGAWDAAWQLRKHGSDDEMDAKTLAHWLQVGSAVPKKAGAV
jgi:hypothetical protein